MKRPKPAARRRPAARQAAAAALALSLAGTGSAALPAAAAAASAVRPTPPTAAAAAATRKQSEASSPVGGRRRPNPRRHRMDVEEEKEGASENRLAGGAIGKLFDALRRRPMKDDGGPPSPGENDALPSTGNDDSAAAEHMDQKPDGGSTEDEKDATGSASSDDRSTESSNGNPPAPLRNETSPMPMPPVTGPSSGGGDDNRRPVYILPRPPFSNNPGGGGGLLIPAGSPSGGGGSFDPASPPSSVQSALLSALSKVLIATLLAPGGLRSSPLLRWLLPRRSRERPYLPDPVQRYTFEKINSRYERDGAALERALLESVPAADRVGHLLWRRWSHRHHRGSGTGTKATPKTKANTSTRSGRAGGSTSSSSSSGNRQDRPNEVEQEHRTVIVLDFCTDPNSPSARHLPTPGHSHAPQAEGHAAPHDPVELLRDQVSFVLEQYHDPAVRSLLGREVEIVLRVESGGGGVQDFGVAADAVRRIRDAASTATAFPAINTVPTVDSAPTADGEESLVVDQTAADATPADDAAAADIVLTVCVDRIAASGGYMVAAQATPGRLFAAPFALVGSIGVYTERVNIHDALTRLGVRGMVLKAGKSKAPIGTIGEVRDSDVSAVQDDLDRVHDAFRSLVKDSRKVGDGENLSEVMEGECFLGQYAQELGLVDHTITSDAYIAERVQAGDKVLRLRRYDKPKAFGGLNLPLSPLDLLLSGGPSEDLFGKLKSKVRASMSSVDLGDGAKFVGIIVGALALLKDFQVSGDQNTRPTVRPQVRYREDKYSYN